jgi:hypothetical protein
VVVALLSLGSTTVNVGMWSSSPCVVCVVSKLAMKSCILVGMDVISQAKVAVVRAYRLGVFREGSEFVLTLRTGPHRSVPLAETLSETRERSVHTVDTTHQRQECTSCS